MRLIGDVSFFWRIRPGRRAKPRSIDFDADVLVLVNQAGVVHLPGDWPGLTRFRILKLQHIDGLTAHRLCDGHMSGACPRVSYNLHAAPIMDVKMRLVDGGEFL